MNTEIPETISLSDANPAPDTPPSPIPSIPTRHRKSKIGRLPKPIRDRINQMLFDGQSYADIITALGPDAAPLSTDNICRWYQTGFQDWLRLQQALDLLRDQADFATDVLHADETPALHHASLHVAAAQLLQNLTLSGPALFTDNPGAYISLLNALSRVSREALAFQKYREACALAREHLRELADPNRQLSDDERRAIVHKLDQILGLK